MAVILDPEQLQKFWLASDEKTPKESRPMFQVRTANRRTRLRHAELRKQAADHEAEAAKRRDAGDIEGAKRANDEKVSTLVEMIAMGVVSVLNMPGKTFAPTIDFLDSILEDDGDLADLACNWVNASRMTEDDVKNSLSPLPSGAANSAKTAEAAPVTTSLPQTNPAPSTPSPAPGATGNVSSTANDAPTATAAAS